MSRRAEYAEATRQAILTAARQLFVERGYFDTRVEDIARAARVAAPTVYAAGGGKSGLLRTLIEQGVNPAAEAEFNARVAAHTDPAELLRYIVDGTRSAFETWSPLMRQVTDAAPQDPIVRESLELAHAGLRNGLHRTANRLADLGALRAGLDAGEAGDLLWYFLNNASYFTLTGDLGWTPTRAADWLHQRLTTVLFIA